MKNERGSIAVLAFVTVMFILIILATLFYSMVEKSKAQVIEMEKLSNTLDGDMGEIYKERKNIQGIYVTLYTNGNLVFANTNKVQEEMGTYTQYGDISSLNFTSTEQIPWYANKENITSVEFTSKIEPTSTAMWFNGLDKLTTITNINYLDTSKVTNMSSMFEGCTSLTTCDLSSLSTNNVENMSSMFENCTNLTTINLGSINTNNVTTMNSMFKGCTVLTSIDLTNLSTDKVTDMGEMFRDCSSLTTLDLSNLNTATVTSMESLFNNCTNLTTIYAGNNWDTSNVSNSMNMFLNCNKIVGGNNTAYDATKVDKEYAKIDTATTTGYLTAKTTT